MSSRVTSEKWISTITEEDTHRKATFTTEGRLVLHDLRPLFNPVWNHQTNLISVFGRARQGKSFLMNCLSGETSLFKVSNYKESCTQGIDISNKFMSLGEFSSVDGGRRVGGVGEGIKVGFVDAEGQGDKDISYDANLICPILLASKCVLFNWKGDLQKDHILSTLGIMTRAARNVSQDTTADTSSATGKKKFGHLHIVFRDWQSVGSDAASVTDILFSPETNNKDAMTRNQIREEVKAAFESIQVWLFDAPTDSVQALRQVLTIDVTTNRFRQQVRDFRAVLARQLGLPVMFAGRPLNGKTIYTMMRDVIDTLNRGEVILPSSTYLTMMKEEVSHLSADFANKVKAIGQDSIRAIDQTHRHSIDIRDPVNNKTKTLSLYLNTADALQDFRGRAKSQLDAAMRLVMEVIGLASPPPPPAAVRGAQMKGPAITATNPTPYETLYLDTSHKLTLLAEETEQSFLIQYQHNFLQQLKQTRKRLEAEIAREAEAILANPLSPPSFLPLTPTNSKDFKEILTKALLERYLGEVNPNNYYTASAALPTPATLTEIQDTVDLLTRFQQPLSAKCIEGFENMMTAMMKKKTEEVKALNKRACEEMKAKITLALQQLTQQHKKGFPATSLYNTLDKEYNRIEALLRDQMLAISAPQSLIQEYLNIFLEDCAALKETSTKEYSTLKENRLYQQFKASDDLLQEELLQLASHWEQQVSAFFLRLEEDPETAAQTQPIDAQHATNTFQALVTKIWKQAIDNVIGWLSDSISRDQLSNETYLLSTPFGAKLHSFLTDCAQPFTSQFMMVLQNIEMQKNQALEDLKRKRAATAKQLQEEEEEDEDDDDYHDNHTLPMDEADYEEDDEDDTLIEGDDVSRAFNKARKESKLTIAEQRQRARDFAERVLGVNFNPSKKNKKKASSSSSNNKKSAAVTASGKKSLQQQREAAKAFAMKNFGDKILEESDEEEEENIRRNSFSSDKKKKRGHEEVTTGEETQTTPSSEKNKNKRRKLSSISSETSTNNATNTATVSAVTGNASSLSSSVSDSQRRKTIATPTKPPAETTVTKKATAAEGGSGGGSGKKKEASSEDPVAAAKKAVAEAQAQREKEAIEKATKRIAQQKQLKTSKK